MSNVKFFADDTSLFSIVEDPKVSAHNLQHGRDKITECAYQWKMSFNFVLSPLKFTNIDFKRVTRHKLLGLIFDPKLSFLKHITEKVRIARKRIGIIKHLASYLPIKSRDQIFKMHIRPHLDYCDMIYHIPIKTKEMSDGDSRRNLNYLMGTLESTQYQAALAVSGAWKGTSMDKLYKELGWETLDERRLDASCNCIKS